jgi:transcriptional regulator with XRE-family HTH domain
VVDRGNHDERYNRAIARLREARKDARVSQAELAAKLGTRQQFVSKYESGERRLDVIEFLDIARALGLAFDEVLQEAIGGRPRLDTRKE